MSAGKKYAVATPLLISMTSRAAHIQMRTVTSFVVEHIDGHMVTCSGRMVERNGLDGMTPTLMIRWRIDGKPTTRRAIYERFGTIEGTTP